MTRHIDSGATAAVVGVMLTLSVAAYGFSQVGQTQERAECPGKVICPISGEEICKDHCPLIDAARADCPGKIECPLTGDLICRDRCPVGDVGSGESLLPACCRSAE